MIALRAVNESFTSRHFYNNLHGSVNTKEVLRLIFGKAAPFLNQKALANVTKFSQSTISLAMTENGLDYSNLYQPRPVDLTYQLSIPQDKERFALSYIDANAPMRSHPLVRIISGSFKDFYLRYKEDCEEADVESFTYKAFMKILRRDRLWKRSLTNDYECRWCFFARTEDHPKHQQGIAHQELNHIQRTFYMETKKSLLNRDEKVLMIQLDYAGIKVDHCVKIYELVIVRFVPEKSSESWTNQVNHYLLPLEANSNNQQKLKETMMNCKQMTKTKMI